MGFGPIWLASFDCRSAGSRGPETRGSAGVEGEVCVWGVIFGSDRRHSKVATPDTEEALISECLGMSNAALDRAARRADPPTAADEREAWRQRWLSIQYTLDGIRRHMNVELSGAELHQVESAIRERADRLPVNPESGMFDPYPARLATVWSSWPLPRVMSTVPVWSRSQSMPISKRSPRIRRPPVWPSWRVVR